MTAIDVSPKMVARTAARASADGLDNINVLEMDAENLRFADETFDAVTGRRASRSASTRSMPSWPSGLISEAG